MGGVRAKCVEWWDTCHGQTKDSTNRVPFTAASYPGNGICFGELLAEVETLRNTLVKSSRGELPEDNFIVSYGLKAATAADDMLPTQKLILLMYFAFTSLSTVGFGDFHPISEYERMFCALILLLGVSIFSYIMGEINEILTQYQALGADLDDGEQLTRFFGLMRQMNEGVPMGDALRNKIEAHFDYKWRRDRNQAVDEEEELTLLSQIPDEV